MSDMDGYGCGYDYGVPLVRWVLVIGNRMEEKSIHSSAKRFDIIFATIDNQNMQCISFA